jgi:hypothetical protein
MDDVFTDRVAWRRVGVRRHYVGSLAAGDWGIRLAGRDPVNGIQVTLSIPLDELDDVHISDCNDEMLVGERAVVLGLVDSEPILVREVGIGSLHLHALARTLGALAHRPRLLAHEA